MHRDPLTQINYATEQGREPFRHWLGHLVLFGGSGNGDQEREIENAHNRLAEP